MRPGHIYTLSKPEYFGRFPVRSELTVIGTKRCSACGEHVDADEFLKHCDKAGDPEHKVLSVMDDG